MATTITIVFWIIACVTLVYISYTACKYYKKTWYSPSPLDVVQYWKMCQETGNKSQMWILYINIVSLIIAIVLSIRLM